jgi:type II secretory pathway pseudopilin PulG
MTAIRMRLRRLEPEAGMTLIELLVASAMSVILVGAACTMLISAVHDQPKLSKKTQEISTARYVLERMTRELRNGIRVYEASGSTVAFETQVRRTECGGAEASGESAPSLDCRVTYSCTATECTRTETDPEVPAGSGTPERLVGGLDSDQVFSYEPGSASPGEVDYVGITLNIENPEGRGSLTVTDGAGLRIKSYLRS